MEAASENGVLLIVPPMVRYSLYCTAVVLMGVAGEAVVEAVAVGKGRLAVLVVVAIVDLACTTVAGMSSVTAEGMAGLPVMPTISPTALVSCCRGPLDFLFAVCILVSGFLLLSSSVESWRFSDISSSRGE